MSGDYVLILEEDAAELQDGDGATVWHSDDDANFNYSQDTDEDEIIAYLVRADVISEDADVNEIVDERENADDDDADDDDDDDGGED